MKDIELIPENIRSKSLSQTDIVLDYEDVLKAFDVLVEKNIVLLAWEGWIQHSNGSIDHSLQYQGMIATERLKDEPLSVYVKKSIDLGKVSIKQAQEKWNNAQETKKGKLFFCITLLQETS